MIKKIIAGVGVLQLSTMDVCSIWIYDKTNN